MITIKYIGYYMVAQSGYTDDLYTTEVKGKIKCKSKSLTFGYLFLDDYIGDRLQIVETKSIQPIWSAVILDQSNVETWNLTQRLA